MFLLALIGTHPSDAPIEALPQESVSYVPTDWPVRQTNHERSGGGACSSRGFAAQRDGHCPNVSTRGMRVATEHVWLPGDPVLLSSPESGVRTQARVVYCQRMENKRFAIGLELLAPLGEWTKPN